MAVQTPKTSTRRIVERDARPTPVSSYFALGIMAFIAAGMVVLQSMGGSTF
jgi:hypothetical protein